VNGFPIVDWLVKDHSLQQIGPFTPHATVRVAPRENFLPAFHFFGGNDGIPISPQCLWRDLIGNAYNPACISPIVKDV